MYPKEIEDVLNELEKIDETAVFGISDNDFGERVVAAATVSENGILFEWQKMNFFEKKAKLRSFSNNDN